MGHYFVTKKGMHLFDRLQANSLNHSHTWSFFNRVDDHTNVIVGIDKINNVFTVGHDVTRQSVNIIAVCMSTIRRSVTIMNNSFNDLTCIAYIHTIIIIINIIIGITLILMVVIRRRRKVVLI